MAGVIHDRRPARLSGRISRFWLSVTLLAGGLAALAAVLVLAAGTSHSRASAQGVRGGSGSSAAVSHPAAGSPPAPPVASGRRVRVAQAADPQESQSFPAPASVRHQAATTPAKAGAVVIAAGAPSDAQVRRELAQMQAVERQARQAQQQQLTPVTGGRSVGGNGTIPIPANVPEVVQKVVAGANAIADFPYVFGGGHASFVDNAYDCSGSVSYALAAGGLLNAPQTSGELESWGAAGPGRFITVYANAGHTYMYVNGILYDTAGRSGVYASRWLVSPVDNAGFVARHWPGL
jgi:cell wall-associated NlpC family hydrolase